MNAKKQFLEENKPTEMRKFGNNVLVSKFYIKYHWLYPLISFEEKKSALLSHQKERSNYPGLPAMWL